MLDGSAPFSRCDFILRCQNKNRIPVGPRLPSWSPILLSLITLSVPNHGVACSKFASSSIVALSKSAIINWAQVSLRFIEGYWYVKDIVFIKFSHVPTSEYLRGLCYCFHNSFILWAFLTSASDGVLNPCYYLFQFNFISKRSCTNVSGGQDRSSAFQS